MWHAGFNAIRGRDHTIHAAATGYVKYYRDPSLHPDKQYIGVAFNREDKLPYPKLEPRRRKLGMVAHVRKKSAGPKPKVSDSGIPNRVMRKAGLFNIEALERRLWNADKRAELKLAAEADARAARKGLKGIRPEAASPVFGGKGVSKTSTTTSTTIAVSQPVDITSPDVTNPDAFAAAATSNAPVHADTPKPSTKSPSAAAKVSAATSSAASITFQKTKPASGRAKTTTLITKSGRRITIPTPVIKPPRDQSTGRAERAKPVTAAEYLQKSWLERRGTKVLLLNPRTYAYAESNSAIGRLSARNMYTAPWKLGGRKSRMRSRRKRWVGQLEKKAADRALVRTEREKERVAAEKKRAEKLAKQRARGRKAEDKTAAAALEVAAASQAAEAVEAAAAVEEARPAEAAILVDSATELVEAAGLPVGGAEPVDGAVAVEAPANEPLAETKEATRPAKTQNVAQPLEHQASARSSEAREMEPPIETQDAVQSIETTEVKMRVESQEIAQPIVAEESSQPAEAEEVAKPVEAKESDEPSKP